LDAGARAPGIEVFMNVAKLRMALATGAVLAAISAGAQQQQDGEAHFNIGLTHLREGRNALALDEFKKAVRLDGKNPYFHKALGLCYLQMRKYSDSVEALRKALQLNPYYVDARNDLGTALILSGKREEGKAELVGAYNEPTNPSPELSARNLGQAYLEERRYQEAASWFGSAVGRNKQLVDAHLGLAEALLGMSRLEEAQRTLEEAVKANPDNPDLLLSLGEAYYRAGRFSEARTRLEEARAKDRTGAVSRRVADLLKQFGK
jgi:tetratricopeptide (TPR) repeat protein